MIRSAALLTLALCWTNASAQSVDEIVALAIAARGGADRIRALQTQRLTGTISVGDQAGNLMVEIKRPSSIREQYVSGANKVLRVSDGNTAWIRVGNGPVEALTPDDVRSMSASADLDGPLLDYKLKGTIIQLAGTVEVFGRKHFKLVIKPRDGNVRTDYIDAGTFLETKWEGTVSDGGKQYTVESFFQDYRSVDGIACAFRIDSNTLGTLVRQKLTFSRIDINPPIDDSRFGKPQ